MKKTFTKGRSPFPMFMYNHEGRIRVEDEKDYELAAERGFCESPLEAQEASTSKRGPGRPAKK